MDEIIEYIKILYKRDGTFRLKFYLKNGGSFTSDLSEEDATFIMKESVNIEFRSW